MDLGKIATNRAPSNVTFLQLPESDTIRIRLIDSPQRDVHEIVAIHEVSV